MWKNPRNEAMAGTLRIASVKLQTHGFPRIENYPKSQTIG